MRERLVRLRLPFVLCVLLLCAAATSGWAAPIIQQYVVQHTTLVRSYLPGGEPLPRWPLSVGMCMTDSAGVENIAGVTVWDPAGEPLPNENVHWPWIGSSQCNACICLMWEFSSVPPVGSYTLQAYGEDGSESAVVVTVPFDHFPEPVPEITYPAPGSVIMETAPEFTWPAYPGFACEGNAPADAQYVDVSTPEEDVWLWGQEVPVEATSALYDGPPLEPGHAYTVHLSESGPWVQVGSVPFAYYKEQTRRDSTFAIYSPGPVILGMYVDRGPVRDWDGALTYFEEVGVSVTDLDGISDIASVIVTDPLGNEHAAELRSQSGPNRADFWWPAWGQQDPPSAGTYTVTVTDREGNSDSASGVTTAELNAEDLPEMLTPDPAWSVIYDTPVFTWWAPEGAGCFCAGLREVGDPPGSVWDPPGPVTSPLAYDGPELVPGHSYWWYLNYHTPDGQQSDPRVSCTLRPTATGRFIVYSPDPVIQGVNICRGECLCPWGGSWYHEGARISVTDLDGWSTVSVTTQTPDGLVLPDPEGCDSSTNDGLYVLNQANGHHPPTAPQGGSYTITATGSAGAASLTTGYVSPIPPMHQITYPTDGAVIPDTELVPTFSWAGAPGAEFLCVCVKDRAANDAVLWLRQFIPGDATSIVYNDDGSAIVPQLTPGGRYLVHVRANYPDEDLSDGVAVGTFTGRTARFGVVSGPIPPPVPIEGKLLVDGWDLVMGSGLSYYMSGTSADVFPVPVGWNHDLSPLGDQVLYDGEWSGDPQVSALDLWKSELDGSNSVNLSMVEQVGGMNCRGRWSPDGAMIAWRHADLTPEEPGQLPCNRMHIWIANADGTDAHRLIPDDKGSWTPAWKPDGSGLLLDAALASGEGGIIAVRTDGTDAHRLPVPACGQGFYSPDGSKVAFGTCTDSGTGRAHSLWVAGADGSDPHVVFENAVSYADIELYLELHEGDIDCCGVMNRLGPIEWAWSPKGDRIAFLAAYPFDPAGPEVDWQREVWLYDLSSAGVTQVTGDLVADWYLSWRGPNTQAGQSVPVRICDVTATFSKVTETGLTTSVVSERPAPPAGYSWIGDAYHIATTAVVQGAVQVAIRYDPALVPGGKAGRLVLLHFEAGKWVDVTDEVDPKKTVVRGAIPVPPASGGTTDLSLFAIAVRNK